MSTTLYFESLCGTDGTDPNVRAPRRVQIRADQRVLFGFEFVGTHQNAVDLSTAIQACGSFRLHQVMELNFGAVPEVAGGPAADSPPGIQEGGLPEGPQG